MKILLIDNFLYRRGGAEVVFLNTGNLLKSKGHEVVYFSQQWSKNQPSEYNHFFPRGIDTKTSSLWERIQGVGKYFYNKEAANKLEKLIIEQKPDIAHAHLFWGGISGSIFRVLQKYNIPLVHTAHDYRMVCPAYAFKNSANQICEQCVGRKFHHCVKNRCSKGSLAMSFLMCIEMYFRNSFMNPIDYIDSFMFVSNFSYNKHLQYEPRFANKHCVTMYNFQDASVLNSVEKGLLTHDSYYLYYGRLSHEKGLHVLIESFADMPYLNLKIVGTGPMEADLKHLCEEKQTSNIEFLGFKTGSELFDIIRKAKFVCVPSECYENNPMTIIESYTLRTPVIGSDLGGIIEIIEDGITGYKFKPSDILSFKETVIKAENMSDVDYYEMKDSAEKFAEMHFDKELYYNRLMDLYQYTIDHYKH